MHSLPQSKALQARAAERELAQRRAVVEAEAAKASAERVAKLKERTTRTKARRAELQALETRPYLLAIADDPEDWWTDFTEIRLNLTDDEALALARLVDLDGPDIFRSLDK